jgi:DNA-binding transcriptional LysR family regulator
MDIARLSRLNLTLLATLHVLLQERHAGRAAKRLHVTQSSVSKNLSQLRDLFKDTLFDRTAQGLTPTPLALTLEPQLAEVMGQLDMLLYPPEFCPQDYQGRIHLAMQDTAFAFIAPALLAHCREHAPHLQFDMWFKDDRGLHELANGEIDLLILPQDIGQHWHEDSRLMREELYREPLACMLRKDHPALLLDWTAETYLTFSHIGVRDDQLGAPMLDRSLMRQNKARQIAATVPDFHAATRLCEESDMIFTCSQSWADLMVKERDMVKKPLPFLDFICTYKLIWHSRTDTSPVHLWLRHRIHDISTTLKSRYGLD